MADEIRGNSPKFIHLDELSKPFIIGKPFIHRLSLNEFEVKAFLERGATMILRPSYDIRFRRPFAVGDFLLGLETFVAVKKKTGVEYTFRASIDKRNQFEKRWSPPFSLPSDRARIKLKVVDFDEKKIVDAPKEWFQLSGYRDANDFKAKNMILGSVTETILVAIKGRKVD